MEPAESWQRLQAVFEEALAMPTERRSAFLDEACRRGDVSRAELEALLDAYEPRHALAIERFVRDSAPGAPLEIPGQPDGADPFIGRLLGPWRVLEVVGRGGMGTVYLAERADGQYEQRVALKLILAAATPGPARSRFQAECRILARLSHPNIARLLDAGFTPDGSAYLVMEYVDGSPLTAYCDEHRLTVEQRLAVFRLVCAATQHAHRSLIVHRDLKPSNIFVSRSGEVKLLDFGIAKLVEPDRASGDTAPELCALTPGYAAPEQLRGEPVTTATDVFVLGVVLYELLSGQRPFDGASRARGSDLLNAIEAGPEAPSRSAPRALAKRLSGDIDRVVLHALQPEPERRYASAGHLAEEIDRLLAGQPVSAQPSTVAYRLRRFVGRHRLGVAAGAAIVVLLMSFAITSALQARATAIERDRARTEANRARRVSLLVADIFRLAEPGATRGDSITAVELLDRGAQRIDAELADDPRTRAELYATVGRVYGNLALHDRAISVLKRAVELQRATAGADGLALAGTLAALGEQSVRTNDYASAIAHFREALALGRRLGAPPAQTAETLEGLGRALSFTGKHEEAEAPLREAVQLRKALPDRSAAETMSALHELALTLHRRGDFRNAEALFREAAEVARQVPARSPARVTGLLYLARLTHRFNRDAARAEPVYREALAAARALYPRDHPETATCLSELARNVRDLGRLAESEALAREALAMLRRLYGTRHREIVITAQALAGVLEKQGKTAEAEVLARESYANAGSLFGASHPVTLGAQRTLAGILEEQRKYPEARALREEGLKLALATFGENDVYVAITLTGLGQHHLGAGNFAAAVSSFRRALAVRERLHNADSWHVDDARARLGLALARAGRIQEAEPLLASGYAGLRKRRGEGAEETRTARRWMAELKEQKRKAG